MKSGKTSFFKQLLASSVWFFAIFSLVISFSTAIEAQPLPKPVGAAQMLGYRTTQAPYIALPNSVYSEITEKYNMLEKLNPTLFNTSILRQPHATRVFLEYLPRHLGSGVHGTIPLLADPSKKISYTYFNRGSKELIVMSGGFANPREMLAPLLGIFVDYDVVIFDHIGHGLDHKPKSWYGWFFKKNFGIDFSILESGEQEESELLSIIQHFKQKKKYAKLYGVGFCYATGIFMKTAANNPGLFDKLILDGAWESGETLLKRFVERPELFYDPQRGAPTEKTRMYRFYKWITSTRLVKKHFNGTATDLKPNGPSLKKLGNVPLLLFHGVNDLVISEAQFNEVWHNKAGAKTAIITDARHLSNHIKYKQLFSWCSNCFLDLGNEVLEYSLSSPEALAQTYEELRQYKEHKQTTKSR